MQTLEEVCARSSPRVSNPATRSPSTAPESPPSFEHVGARPKDEYEYVRETFEMLLSEYTTSFAHRFFLQRVSSLTLDKLDSTAKSTPEQPPYLPFIKTLTMSLPTR
jgi:hypothetical protein